MRLKLYRANEMGAAMAQVRRDFGADAVILSSRKTFHGVELTAAVDDPQPPAVPCANTATQRGLAYHGVPGLLALPLSIGALSDRLQSTLNFGALPLASGDRPLLFTGPPGAGKTLTVARLATRLVMHGVAPLVITADATRAGAAEQLAAFTRLLGLDLVVASHPVALARALARRASEAPVLIDLPGGSPFDPDMQAMIGALTAIANGRVVLVLAAGTDVQDASETATAYAQSGAEYLVITRLDIARRIGCVISAGVCGLILTEIGIGAGAADGLVPATAAAIASRLLEIPPGWECSS